jgi:hypothetical protein
MNDIIKSFEFESENIKLVLNIKKEVHKDGIKMIIEGTASSENKDVKINQSENGTSRNISLTYKNKGFFWISSNDYKGLRWDTYDNETKFSIYHNLKEMKEQYIIQREKITLISNYFYDCIKKFKEIQMLYETPLEDLTTELD